jgi:segregation and condensation protein B
MFGTTKLFLDYFGLKKLDDLPPLADLSDWESLRVQLNLPAVDEDEVEAAAAMSELPDLPVLHPADEEDEDDVTDDDVAEALAVIERGIPDIESALSAEAATNDDAESDEENIDTDLEPIEAKAWPDPIESDTAVRSLDVDSEDDADAEADEQEADIDASATNA